LLHLSQFCSRIKHSLSDDRRSRFLRLRARCVEMQRIANAVRIRIGGEKPVS